MNPPADFSTASSNKALGRKRLRRLAITVFIIVVAAHILAGVGSAIWIVARYLNKPAAQFTVEKRVEVKPEEREHKVTMDQVAAMAPRQNYTNRIQSLVPSKLTLPDLPKTKVEAVIPMDVTSVVAAPGVGNANGMSADGGAQGGGFFGGAQAPGSGSFEGTLYDLKQDKGGKPTEYAFNGREDTDNKRMAAFEAFTNRFVINWNPAMLSRYFSAPAKLYTSQFSIPMIPSVEGPKQFHVENVVKVGYWLALYTGRVIAPVDGQFRFVGSGDNVLFVRFAGRNVLDGSLYHNLFLNKSAKRYIYANLVARIPGYEKEGKGTQGNVVGKTFTVKKGEAYDMEVLIGESDGGRFTCSLMIEQIGVNYQKDSRGTPILPFFKQKESTLENTGSSGLPTFDPNAPIWLPAPVSRTDVPTP